MFNKLFSVRATLTILLFAIIALYVNSATAQYRPENTLKVFVLAGQSNMQGHAVVDMDHEEHYNGGKGNLVDVLKKNPKRFAHLKSNEKWSKRDDVKVRFATSHGTKTGNLSIGFAGYRDCKHFGPELQFGHIIGDYLQEPVLIIKTAWGGKSLLKDFRSPTAVKNRGGEVGEYYNLMMKQVSEGIAAIPDEFPEWRDKSVELCGFVWQQGWNDMIDDRARNEYHENLVDLIVDVRKTWAKPGLPVVVGELGNGGKDVAQSMKQFRRQQARIASHPAFIGTVHFAKTAQHARPKGDSPNIGHGHHWFGNAESYLLIGDSLGKEMIRILAQPATPRVLILGDSISMGYMPFVKQHFERSAFVVRPGENCAGTDHGITNIDKWISIAGGNWDVIHFNFGLHDLKHVNPDTGKNSNNPDHPEQSSPADYERQLRTIVAKLKATNAKLIFATTTPVPEGGVKPYRDPNSPTTYNEIAVRVMKEHGIEVNDLYTVAKDNLSKIQKPVNVHFTKDGSAMLAGQVIECLQKAMAGSK